MCELLLRQCCQVSLQDQVATSRVLEKLGELFRVVDARVNFFKIAEPMLLLLEIEDHLNVVVGHITYTAHRLQNLSYQGVGRRHHRLKKTTALVSFFIRGTYSPK